MNTFPLKVTILSLPKKTKKGMEKIFVVCKVQHEYHFLLKKTRFFFKIYPSLSPKKERILYIFHSTPITHFTKKRFFQAYNIEATSIN